MRSLNKKKVDLAKEVSISKFSVENNTYDKLLFSEIAKYNTPVQAFLEDSDNKTPTIKEMGQDLFSLIFKYMPDIVPQNKIRLSHTLNRELSKLIVDMPEYKELRNISRMDEMTSAFAFEVMSPLIKKQLQEMQEEADKLAEQYGIDINTPGDNNTEESEDSDKKDVNAKADSPPITDEEAQKQLQDYLDALHNTVRSKKTQREIQAALKLGVAEANEVSELIQNWGLTSADSFINGNYESKFTLLQQLRKSKKLREIAELAGRYKQLAAQIQHEKIQHGMNEVYDITQGTDLSKLLPTEKMKFRHPILRKLVLKDWLEHKTLQYNTRSKEKKQRGPVIICIDNSGSMSGASEIWAKAVALGILEICKIQKRDLYVIQFEAETNPYDLKCNVFYKNKYEISNVIDMIEYFAGGGTLFEPALTLAKEKINTLNEFQKADIIFITDGEAPVRDNWVASFNKWRKEKHVQIMSVIIDASYCSDISLKKFSDQVIKLTNLRANKIDAAATELFCNI